MSTTKYDILLTEEIEYQKASNPISSLPTCTDLFDKWAQCFALGPQLRAVYQYGGFQDCKGKLDDFKYCLTQKGMTKEEKYETWIKRRAEKVVDMRIGRASSENVWEIRR